MTCAAGEWAASNTFSMIASKIRQEDFQRISQWSGHGNFHGPHIHNFLVSSYINRNVVSKLLLESETESWGRVPNTPSLNLLQLAAT